MPRSKLERHHRRQNAADDREPDAPVPPITSKEIALDTPFPFADALQDIASDGMSREAGAAFVRHLNHPTYDSATALLAVMLKEGIPLDGAHDVAELFASAGTLLHSVASQYSAAQRASTSEPPAGEST